MNAKTVQKLLNIDPHVAEVVCGILHGTTNPADYPGGSARIAECYNPPEDYDVALHAINKLIGGFGVEYIAHKDDSYNEVYGLEYINMGDTYAPTIIYNHATESYVCCSYGDIVENSEDYI